MPQSRFPRVSIVGAGSVGSSIGRALFEKGYPIASVISRTGDRAIALGRSVKCSRVSTQIGDVAPDSECILLTVSDSAIPPVAGQLSRVRSLKFKKLFAVHCSGVHAADVLEPLRRRGTLVASMHPIQTFPAGRHSGHRRISLRGIYYGIEGQPDALRRVKRMVDDLEGRVVVIRKEMKPLYHVICVMASNYMLVFLNAIEELTNVLSVQPGWTEIFGPLMTATMENAVKQTAAASLTGPIVRGDLSTVDLHLRALSRYAPEFLPLYTMGGIEVARIASMRGNMSRGEFNGVIGRFRRFVKSNPFTNKRKAKR